MYRLLFVIRDYLNLYGLVCANTVLRFLGFIQGHIGGIDEVVHFYSIFRIGGDPDADSYMPNLEFLTDEEALLVDRLTQSLCEDQGRTLIRVRENDRKFLSAVTKSRVTLADITIHQLTQFPEQIITRQVPILVIVHFKIIKIANNQG
jgi:hypothetical protein